MDFSSMMTAGGLSDLIQIIITDLVLSGDNALIIGMAAAGLSPELRKKAIFFGILIAALLRIVFAVLTTYILAIPGIQIIGALMLFYVCWKLYKEIRDQAAERAAEAHGAADHTDEGYQGPPKRTLWSALWAITVADVSMSIDNVIAVAGIAGHDRGLLVFGLVLAIIMMAFFATFIMKLLTRYPMISWIGLIVLIHVAAQMMWGGLHAVGIEIPGLPWWELHEIGAH